MKIKKSSSKKLAPLPRQLCDIIQRLENEDENKIPSIVLEIEHWTYGRGDLFHWVTVLDRFDLILARICTDYNLKEIQIKPFNDTTKTLIMSILHLSSLLFENCTNRNIYNSYEHLSLFLNTFDIDVLLEVLHFMIRPAQRINNPKAIRSSFVVPQEKIMELARGWNNVPVDLLSIAQELNVTPKMMTLSIQFYRTATEPQTTEGYELVNHLVNQEDDISLFQTLVKKHTIPEEYHFELANRIRIARHINQPKERRQLLSIRILAIAIMSHAISETTAQNKVFIYEPHLIAQLAELIVPEKHVDMAIQTYVLYALDAITRHRSKLSEVLTAVNASANHGTMMQILRKTNSTDEYTQPFLDALFTFVSYLLQTPQGGQMLMTAGIIPTLVHIVGNHQYTQLKNISKIVGLIDTIVNSYSTSFSAFCNAEGLDVLLNRIRLEVDTGKQEETPAYDRLSAIKAMLKFLLRMMESSGTADGLRNLIDSSLPQSLKVIMEYPKRFGNSIFALAIHVSTTFIHNEPTSLPILQEARLPQSFLKTIAHYETPNSEVLMAAVNAFGAMCLNSHGLEMFNEEKPLGHFFELMTSIEFLSSSADVDSATGLGSTMDELIRHHPSLKRSVFDCVTVMIKKVIEMGSDLEGIGKPSDDSHLIHARSAVEDRPEKVECLLVSFIDLVSRFLEGLFQNQSNINEFVEGGCPEMLLSYFSLPLLPAAFSVTIASDSLSYLFRMISEVSPLPTVMAIATKVKESIHALMDSYPKDNKSMLLEYIDVSPEDTETLQRGNKILRQLVQLHGYVGLLSNICCSSVLTHGKNALSLVTEFLSESENIIELLGHLHRSMTWENLLLKEGLPAAWYAFKSVTNTSASLALKKTAVVETAEEPTDEEVPPAKDARMLNVKYFKLLLTEIPQLLLPIFQGLIKVSLNRRTGNTVPKPQMMQLAEHISSFLIENMTWNASTTSVCKYDYRTTVYTMTSVLLKDERTQLSLQTPLAVQFEKHHGIDILVSHFKEMCAIRVDTQEEQTVTRLDSAIEALLTVLLDMSSKKSLRDSPYTTAMINKNPASPDYFEPTEWVTSVELRLIPLKEYLECAVYSKNTLQLLLKIFQQIMKSDTDTTRTTTDPFSTFTPLLNSPFPARRSVVASELNIQTLIDMGFQRTAAEQALSLCGNQVNRAVDYLFNHPTPVIAPPVEQSMDEYSATSSHVSEHEQSDMEEDDQHRLESDNQNKLNKIRHELSDELIPALLKLCDQREDLVFDVRDLLVIIGCEDKKVAESVKIITQLMDSIAAVSKESTQSVLLSVRLRLLALLLREVQMQHAMNQLAYRFSFLFDMLSYLDIPEQDPLPPSSATILLVLDAFIAQSDSPRKDRLISLPNLSDDSDDPMEDDEPTTTVTSEQRSQVLGCCVSLLKRSLLSRDDIYAILRMIVRLTKNHEIALQFVQRGGIPLLFTKPRSSLEGLQGQQAFIILILRHIVESKSVLIGTMEDIIINWFTNPRPRNMDINSFIRNNAQLALRSPSAFIEVATDVCRIVQVDDYRSNPHIKLRKTEPKKEKTSSSELVVYYLLDEIMAVKTEEKDDVKFVYTGFLLQCLVELTSSYASCKHDIYNYCKQHKNVVSMLLHDLLPYNYANPLSEESRKEQGLSTWAASTLVAMSYDVSTHTDMNGQQKNELIQVRKFVMESIVRALKEAIHSDETASVRYSRYLAIADLCYRILNARPTNQRLPRMPNQQLNQQNNTKEDVLSNSKIMLDKGFVAVLTTAISDIDINYPHSKSILNAMLRPLEQLTKLSIKIEENTGEDKEDKMVVEEDILPTTPIAEGEAPDLYRNSALGMFDAGSVIDEDEYNSDEYSEMFGSSGDEEDDFDEASGSDLSDMSEGDEDEVDEEMVLHRYDSDEMDEDEDENEIEVEAEIIDESEDDEEGSREMTWHLEDIEEEPSIVHTDTVIDNGEESHIRHISDVFENEDEFEALSDFDEASENMDGQSDNEIADSLLLTDDMDRPFLSGDLVVDEDFERTRPAYPVSLRRRFPHGRRANDGRMFRTPGHAGQEDVITHPLLSNTTQRPTPYTDDSFPHSRHNGFSNWQDFEDIIGGNAVRMLEDLLTHTPSANQAIPLRVDIQSGLNGPSRSFEFDRFPHITPPRPVNSDVQDILTFLNDFQPMSSAERWHQEALMMYGNNINEKASKLINSILNILIPIAMEEDKKTRAEEEKKRIEKRRKDEEDRKKAEEEKWKHEKEKAAQEAQEAAEEEVEDAPVMDERVMISVNGEQVDISGMGIDVEFLEALPDDLREEVINQHRQNMPTTTDTVDDDSISPEFLNALPPEIREEVLHQEAIDRVRRDRSRQTFPSILAGGSNGRRIFDLAELDNLAAVVEENKPEEKKKKRHRRDGAIQLVDKSQLATLVRLLFVPQTISKSLLNRLLLNLCENSKTRGDLLSYLVCVLHDGNNDLSSVDSSFSHLASNGKAIKPTLKKSAETVNVPNFIAQRCLEALTYIVSCNEQSMSYFLTESESLAILKKSSANRKGKSKEKIPIIWNKYPILVLMNLLDRPVFITNSSLMEQLMDLLSTMCRPFPLLVKKYEEKVEKKDYKQSMPKPPTIPDYYLKLVVHVLTNGECSSKTFQYTLNAISHLSALDGAQQTIVNELVADAKQSGAKILADLDSLLAVLRSHRTGTEIGSHVLSPFSAATSYQAKLLRVLKTLDYMFSRKTTSEEDKTALEQQAKNEKQLLQIYESLDFLRLWKTLGQCLSVIHEKEELINVATVLLPLIESFMVVSKCAAEKGHEPTSPTSDTFQPESFFFTFTEKHKKVLNIMVRNNPTLMSGSFALLVRNPKMLEFDNKRNYFVQQLKRSSSRDNYTVLQLNVRRQYVFEDSYHQLQGRSGEEIKDGKLSVRFYDEEGVDAGGVTREWFSVLARQMFDPNYALFITSAADKLTYQPNRASAVNSDHLSFFKFVGRVIGKAIYDGRLLDAYFTRSFYKHILGRPVDYRDVEALDPEYYKSLVWMLENDITDIIDLTFSMETDYFGTKETIDLKPNGRMIPVTEANKHEYVTLVTEQKLTTAIKDQINAFVQGFHDIIPASLIQIFNEQELELLISGLPDIDIDDWKNNTEYQGYTASSPPVQWFWRAVRSFDQEERAKLLQFATGTSKVPLEGFAHLQGSNGVQKFQIHKDFGGENRLPSAHTCFNQIDLPQYDSYDSLRVNLFKAISECSTGFAFV